MLLNQIGLDLMQLLRNRSDWPSIQPLKKDLSTGRFQAAAWLEAWDHTAHQTEI